MNKREKKEIMIGVILTISIIVSYIILRVTALNLLFEIGYNEKIVSIIAVADFLFIVCMLLASCFFIIVGYVNIKKKLIKNPTKR